MKGRTKWKPRSIEPVHHGVYECIVRISRAVPPMIWMLHWDGNGFRTEIPMIVLKWRGLTRKAYLEAVRAAGMEA